MLMLNHDLEIRDNRGPKLIIVGQKYEMITVSHIGKYQTHSLIYKGLNH